MEAFLFIRNNYYIRNSERRAKLKKIVLLEGLCGSLKLTV